MIRPTKRAHLRGAVGSLACALLVSGAAAPVAAQSSTDLAEEIRKSRERLEEIRAERARLQREMESLTTRVHDVSSELENIERQLEASRAVVDELEFQLQGTAQEIRRTTSELARTRDRIRERKVVLRRRLREIYKRGPLHTVRVLLSAESFGDLLSRYRYLRLITDYDRRLVERVLQLEEDLVAQDRALKSDLAELGRLRQEKLGELAELQRLESRHQRMLSRVRTREEATRSRLGELEKDEEELSDVIVTLERRRREEERRRRLAGAPEGSATLSTRDRGSLDWPVDGSLIYRFGRERRPDGTVLRWNGIGIAADPGTPVRAVETGTVMLAGPFEGYGPMVLLSHGRGFYTVYLYLEEIRVSEGTRVAAGDVVGTVGGEETPEGPHLEFQIRTPVTGGSPQAVDPLPWLRVRGGR